MPRILIVDDSRVGRVSMSQRMREHFDVREESDGEAAWQTLVLDQSIRAVVSDLQMPKMDGFGLLERLRSSKLRRLQQMPFILVSGEDSEEEQARARKLGVSDFIAKGSGSNEVLTRLNNLLALAEAREHVDAGREHMVHDPVSGLFTRKYLELQAAQALSHAARHGGDVSVLVLGFDGFDMLCEHLGATVADEVGHRFARMLAAKMRQEDSLGHFGSGQFAVISPGTAPQFCATFAERVRQAVEVAKLSVQGQVVSLTVSLGIASVPTDLVSSAGALLDLAGDRMRMAELAGGNRIESGGMLPATRPISLPHALELLQAGRSGVVLPHLEALLVQLRPLLVLMDKELNLGLPAAVLDPEISGRANEEN